MDAVLTQSKIRLAVLGIMASPVLFIASFANAILNGNITISIVSLFLSMLSLLPASPLVREFRNQSLSEKRSTPDWCVALTPRYLRWVAEALKASPTTIYALTWLPWLALALWISFMWVQYVISMVASAL